MRYIPVATGTVRYVEMTTGTTDRRFYQHRRGPYNSIGVVQSWMRDEWRDGFLVRIALLERCEYSLVDERETYWINLFDNLLNERKYYRPNLPQSYKTRTPKIPGMHTSAIIFLPSRLPHVVTASIAEPLCAVFHHWSRCHSCERHGAMFT